MSTSTSPTSPLVNLDPDTLRQVELVAAANSTPDNWAWLPKRFNGWTSADEEWQMFATKWRNAKEEDIYKVDDNGTLKLEVGAVAKSASVLLIRDCYLDAYRTAWTKAASLPTRGVIFTGQPGIGKTTFLWYLLVCLLQQKQLVLFQAPGRRNILLFYHDGVYSRSRDDMDDVIPSALDLQLQPKPFIWSLFDVGPKENPPEYMTDEPLFVVQAPSPNSIRYETWRKKRLPLFTGLPLWTRDELERGLRLHPSYPEFMQVLGTLTQPNALGKVSNHTKFPGLLTLLQMCSHDRSPESADEAVTTLLTAVIEQFGYVARDVFNAMFNFEDVMEWHEPASATSYDQLREIVSTIASKKHFSENSVSHRAVCVYPAGPVGIVPLKWCIEFKSPVLAKHIVQRLDEQGEYHVREMTSFLSRIPAAKSLAGWFFEAIAHRAIVGTFDIAERSPADGWSLRKMKKTLNKIDDCPTFTLDMSSQPSTSLSLPKVARNTIRFKSGDIPTRFDDDAYYIPDATNYPLFDAFIVQLNFAANSAHLWLLQITTSNCHRGSAMDYPNIREIISNIRQQLLDGEQATKRAKRATTTANKVDVHVHYVLVCPAGEATTHAKWSLPKGWSESVVRVDHRGDGYLMEVPLMTTAEAHVQRSI